mmetsp:Transcript_2137/g.5644  ORF Transcript_2137/g.5644 Transcript_2137/m.5644 type:complete len:393 (+) Transcript_2137:746-1924(+)
MCATGDATAATSRMWGLGARDRAVAAPGGAKMVAAKPVAVLVLLLRKFVWHRGHVKDLVSGDRQAVGQSAGDTARAARAPHLAPKQLHLLLLGLLLVVQKLGQIVHHVGKRAGVVVVPHHLAKLSVHEVALAQRAVGPADVHVVVQQAVEAALAARRRRTRVGRHELAARVEALARLERPAKELLRAAQLLVVDTVGQQQQAALAFAACLPRVVQAPKAVQHVTIAVEHHERLHGVLHHLAQREQQGPARIEVHVLGRVLVHGQHVQPHVHLLPRKRLLAAPPARLLLDAEVLLKHSHQLSERPLPRVAEVEERPAARDGVRVGATCAVEHLHVGLVCARRLHDAFHDVARHHLLAHNLRVLRHELLHQPLQAHRAIRNVIRCTIVDDSIVG